jgi:hypothetical protein
LRRFKLFALGEADSGAVTVIPEQVYIDEDTPD